MRSMVDGGGRGRRTWPLLLPSERPAVTIFDVPADGPLLLTEADAVDLVGATYGSGADLIAIPVERFAPEFWTLSNTAAGHFIQKLVTYGLRLAIVGDISAHMGRSKPLADFVIESNRRGRELIFVSSRESLEG